MPWAWLGAVPKYGRFLACRTDVKHGGVMVGYPALRYHRIRTANPHVLHRRSIYVLRLKLPPLRTFLGPVHRIPS